MRYKGFAAWLALVTSGATAVIGCNKDNDSTATESAAPEPSKPEEVAVMGQYAEAFNALIDKPQACLDEYFQRIPAEGPVAGEQYRLFARHSLAAPALNTAKSRIAAASKEAPKSLKHLEPLANAALADLERAVAHFSEVHKYYDSESYRDDEGAKGQELHQEMVKLAQAYRTSISQFEAALAEVEERHNEAELKKYEKDKGYSYWFRAFNFEANRLVKASDNERFREQHKAFETAYRGLKAFSDSKQGELHATFKSYLNQAESLHSTALKASRAIAEPKPNPAAISRLRDDLIDDYNTVVSVTNALYQLEANELLK